VEGHLHADLALRQRVVAAVVVDVIDVGLIGRKGEEKKEEAEGKERRLTLSSSGMIHSSGP